MMKSKKIRDSEPNYDSVFENFSSDWWNVKGAFKPLHSFNLLRVKYLIDSLDLPNKDSLKGIRILDIGCGGGIFCEPLARLNATVYGIDSNESSILAARKHAKKNNLKITYKQTDIEEFKSSEKFDVITCMEVLEHVEDVQAVLKKIKLNLKKNGLFIGSTINKTFFSYIFAILFAENILKIVPKNTHEWKKFIKPNNLKKILIYEDFKLIDFKGTSYNPLLNSWKYKQDKSINYIFSAKL